MNKNRQNNWKKILKNELKPPEMGIFWMEKLQKNFFFHIFTHSWRKYAKSY